MNKQRILDGKVTLITGASKGLGKAMAVSLAGGGARLALVSRNKADLDGVCAELRTLGAEAEVYVADITQESDVAQLAHEVAGRFGHVHILVNNAGINIRKNVTDFTLEEWNRVITTNLTGAFLMCRSFIPLMRGQGYGRILNLTSIMSHVSMAQRSAYSASKAGLLGFTRALALELAPEGITVNGISPGPCATEMNRPLLENPEVNQQFTSRIPVGRWGKVEEIGELALFLCSPGAAFITGTDIVIDGGWCAQ
jgi:NAD(P)-dependent dehydrogenase (short-subunit alcohol dehydrogenase family)